MRYTDEDYMRAIDKIDELERQAEKIEVLLQKAQKKLRRILDIIEPEPKDE